MEDESKLRGLGGWLILVGIGVVVSPLRQLVELLPMYGELFADGTIEALSVPGSEFYTPWFFTFLVGEMAINLLVFLAGLWLIYLYFTKHYLFPKVYIALVVISLAFILFDAWVVTLIFPEMEMLDPETLREVARTTIALCVWAPYMLVSRRVALTFVEKRPPVDSPEMEAIS